MTSISNISVIFMHRLEEISGAASKEYSLEKAMEKMKFEWKDMMFEFISYRDTVSVNIHLSLINNSLMYSSVCST